MTNKKFAFGIPTLLIIGSLVLFSEQASWSKSSKQQIAISQQRTLSKLVLPDEPIEIINIKFKSGEAASFSEKDAQTQRRNAIISTSDENWLEKLDGQFKNISTKTIIRLQYALKIPSPDNPRRFLYQAIPFLTANIRLAPGEAISLRFGDKAFQQMMQVKQSMGPSSIESAMLQLDFVEFDDQTAWRLGKFLRKDSKNPDLWIVTGINNVLRQSAPQIRKTLDLDKISDGNSYSLVNASYGVGLTGDSGYIPRSTAAYDCATLMGSYEKACGGYYVNGEPPMIVCKVFGDVLFYNPDGLCCTNPELSFQS